MSILFTNNPYPFKHWITSLVLGPLFEFIYALFYNSNFKLSTDIISIYILYLIFGLVFSLPVFVCYLILFNVLIKKRVSTKMIKILLNLLAIVSMFFLIKSIGGTAMTTSLCISYSIGILICSYFYKLNTTSTT